MANNILPILLNQGLDTVTPPLLAKEGALIDCLNYEVTGDVGYKRIDGYERFDGYPNGAVGYYFTVNIDAGANQAQVVVGAVLSRPVPAPTGADYIGDTATDDAGIVVAVNGGTSYTYIPFDASGSLRSGESIIVRNTSGTNYSATVTSNAVDGRASVTDAATYLSNLRSYSSVLRNAVQDAPSDVVGLWWMGKNLYLALDATVIQFTYNDVLAPLMYPGTLFRFNGTKYRLLDYVNFSSGDSPSPGEVRVAAIPLGAATVTDDDVVEIDSANTLVVTHSSLGSLVTASEYAYVVKCNVVPTSTKRGFTTLSPTYRVPFDAGSYTSETLPKTGWTLRNAAGTKTINCRIAHTEITSGTFGAGTAAGYVYLCELSGESGGSNMQDNWELWYDSARRLTVNAANRSFVHGPRLSGTRRVNAAGTRYQAVVANYYGNKELRSVYGTTGSSRGFWSDERCFGSIYTQEDEALDQPKYVAYHAGRLALGFEVGSVLRSKVGSPLVWSGSQGAQEIATGDKITGLLELPGDSLVVFGRNSIRRLDSSGEVTTISSSAGAFDYTAVMVGHTAMYTGINGISTLEQTSAYGDFQGQRASAKVQNWIRARLLVDNSGFDTGGVAMALPVRNKDQYRLFLKNGQVIVLTATTEGFKITKSNYGNGNDLRVPYAWSSSVADDGKEHINVVWDYSLAQKGVRGVTGTLPSKVRVYELDNGWGFDGVAFSHYFDTAHVFVNNASQTTGIDKVRLHGQGYGVGSLTLRASGIEEDYDQSFSSANQDISLPATPVLLRTELSNFTSIVDHANYGLGIKLRIEGSQAVGSTSTEPSHICQVLVLHINSEGAIDA